jgi:large subunit ribosomal protein L23
MSESVNNAAISKERLMKILLAPRVSEKAMNAADNNNQFVFKVILDANKAEIKQAIELLFEVKVTAVQVIKVKGKRKTFGKIQGRRSDWKKAYISLADGYDINFGTE